MGRKPKKPLRKKKKKMPSPPPTYKGAKHNFYLLPKSEQVKRWLSAPKGCIPKVLATYYKDVQNEKKRFHDPGPRIIKWVKVPKYAPYEEWSEEELAKETPANIERIKRWESPRGPDRKGRPPLDLSKHQRFGPARVRRKRHRLKLSPSEVEWIRCQAGTGLSYQGIADAFNAKYDIMRGSKGVRITRETAFQIITYKTHVPKWMKDQKRREEDGAVDIYDLINSELTDEELDDLGTGDVIFDDD